MQSNRVVVSQSLVVASSVFLCLDQGALALDDKSTVETLVKLLSQWNSKGNNQTVLSEAARRIDYKSMAEASLGPQNWGKLSEAQRNEFVKSFRTLVEKRYYPRWHSIFSKSQVTYGKESAQGNGTRIKTQMTLKDSVQEVDWDLKGQGAAAKVVNLTVGDKDLVVRASHRFQKRLDKAGFPAFMTWINAQADSTVSSSED